MSKLAYIIAGEASGDLIGGELLAALKAKTPELRVSGIGGAQLQKQGLVSLFNMHEIALMGFAEVLPHIPRLKKRIRETVADIITQKPDILITIDSPGFTFRVVKALKKHGFTAPCLHYVAPTVWAYKPKRAAKTAALFDALLCILPFEPPYFQRHGLQTHFVGHPIAWLHRTRGDGAAFRAQQQIAPDALVLGMMPGSRRGELARHLPIFRKTAQMLVKQLPKLHIVIAANADMAEHIKSATHGWKVPVTVAIAENNAQKANAFAACNLALAKSGTVALECSLAGIPMVTTFKANALSAALVKRLINVPYVNLINLMAYFSKAPAPIPELLQQQCTPQMLSNNLLKLAQSQAAQHAQQEACALYFDRLGMNEAQSPSENAAGIVLEYLEKPAT